LRSNTAPTRSGPGEHAEDVLPEPRDMLAKPPAPSSRPLSIPGTEWSWDITKLLGPVKWTYYYLYVLLDIFSRYVVGWLLARQEAAALAKVLIAESCERQHIGPDQLTIHADRGPSMTSQPVALLLATLGVVPSHSRPQVSDDNPFSEAQFTTLKYRPDFPARFGVYEDAEAFCQRFFPWYNTEHRHSALGLMTPHDIHHGLAQAKGQVAAARGHPARRLPRASRAFPARGAGPPAVAHGGLDQQASGGADARRARGDRLMTAAHKFPKPTVSFDLTTSAVPPAPTGVRPRH
jgi:putative transposase